MGPEFSQSNLKVESDTEEESTDSDSEETMHLDKTEQRRDAMLSKMIEAEAAFTAIELSQEDAVALEDGSLNCGQRIGLFRGEYLVSEMLYKVEFNSEPPPIFCNLFLELKRKEEWAYNFLKYYF